MPTPSVASIREVEEDRSPLAAPVWDRDFAAIAEVIGERSRVAMLLALAGGAALPARDLARTAGVRPSTATAHLGKLAEAGLVVGLRSGRERYYRLRGHEVAEVIESLQRLAPNRPVRSLRESIARERLRFARTCYDHLAGEVGVDLFEALVRRRVLRRIDLPDRPIRKVRSALGAVSLGPAAGSVCADLGLDLEHLKELPRHFATVCLDWTEDRPHLSGALGAAFCARFDELGWIRKADARAVVVTELGRRALKHRLGLDIGARNGIR
jgi:DNA-binding transcriptional ArsR family regulator